jgi:hypothetical protein
MHSYGISLNEALDDFGVGVLDTPDEHSSLAVVADHTVLGVKRAQLADHPYCVFVFVALYLRVGHVQVAVLFDPDCWNDGVAGLDKIVETEDAVGEGGLAPLQQHDDVVHLAETHPVHELALQLLYVLVVLENIQDVFMLQ